MAMHKLSRKFVATVTKNGVYGDGGNLWLQVTNNGAGKSWVFRWTDRVTKKDRPIGLGPLHTIDIDMAREKARHNRQLLLEGKDPAVEKAAILQTEKIEAGLAKTVDDVLDEFYDKQIKFTGKYNRKAFLGITGRYVRPRIGKMPIALVTKAVFLDGHPIIPKGRYGGPVAPTALEDRNKVGFRELWAGDKHRRLPTAEQLLSIMQRAIDFAIHHDPPYRDGPNPLDWDSLKHDLPERKRVHKVEHRKELPYTDAPRFLSAVRAYQDRSVRKRGHPTRALWVEFIALTGVRVSEPRLATWAEMKGLEGRHPVWVVPPEHHKIGPLTDKPHIVPITKPMLAVLREMARRYPNHKPTDLVFPSPYDGRDPRSKRRGVRAFDLGSANTFIHNALKWDMHIHAHGFRSTLKDWARSVGMPIELYDIQAAHLPRGKVDQAYGHDQLVEARRPWMEDWGKFCDLPPAGAEVVEAGAEIHKFKPKNRRRTA